MADAGRACCPQIFCPDALKRDILRSWWAWRDVPARGA